MADSRFITIVERDLNSFPLQRERAGQIAGQPSVYVNRSSTSFTLAIPAVPAEVAAAGVLELAVAFGADADHVGHDGAGDGFLGVMLFARDGTGGVG